MNLKKESPVGNKDLKELLAFLIFYFSKQLLDEELHFISWDLVNNYLNLGNELLEMQ